MSKEIIEVFAEPIEGTNSGERQSYAIGEVRYSKGGTNYFTGNTMKRGYRIAVDVRQRREGWESFILGDSVGRGEFLLEAKAFNAKKLASLVSDQTVLAKLQDLKALVLSLHRAKEAEKKQRETAFATV